MLSAIASSRWLYISIIFIVCLDAYDVSQKKPPQGPLGIALDYSVAISYPQPQDPNNKNVARNWMWSSHLEFAQEVGAITDGQLWQMAEDAYNEMMADATQYGMGRNAPPLAMTVLAFGSELIFASSMKGVSYSYTYENTPVLAALRLCQAASGTNTEHRNKGNCGEVTAAHLYYLLYDTPLSARNARIATMVKQKGKALPTDPCGAREEDTWGCNLFVTNQGLTELDIDAGFSPYNLDTLAGGVVVKDQIELCSAHRARV